MKETDRKPIIKTVSLHSLLSMPGFGRNIYELGNPNSAHQNEQDDAVDVDGKINVVQYCAKAGNLAVQRRSHTQFMNLSLWDKYS